MPTIDLGAIGAVLSPADEGFVDVAVRPRTARLLDDLAHRRPDGRPDSDRRRRAGDPVGPDRVGDHLRRSVPGRGRRKPVHPALEHEQPGRFVVGLGGAHGADPIGRRTPTSTNSTPCHRPRLMAALGPRMLRLARDRARRARSRC